MTIQSFDVDQLFETIVTEAERRRRRPGATYRLQFHAGFTFRDATVIVPYLAELGITDVYASPYLKAAPGSRHGYDITNHGEFNPEVGSAAEHDQWITSLHEHGLRLILDIVPNHMGIVGNQNPWWNDVLENGESSPFASYFDIDWSAPSRPETIGRVLLPLLEDLYGEVLERRSLQVAAHADGHFEIHYHEHRFPLDPGSYGAILGPALDAAEGDLGPEHEAVLEGRSILAAVRNLPSHRETDPERTAERRRESEVIKRRIAALAGSSPSIAKGIAGALTTLNGTVGDRASFDALDHLLESQPYRLASWRVAADEINYRRFFDVNSLAAIGVERPEVFRATHVLPLALLASGQADGVRIDHPDGLYDPKQYLDRLQEEYLLALGRQASLREGGDDAGWDRIEPELRSRLAAIGNNRPFLYVVVEKILGVGETLAPDWATDGTSGYDALNWINSLFVDGTSEADFTRWYRDWSSDSRSFTELAREKRQLILEVFLTGELHTLARQLERIAAADRRSRDFTLNALRVALREVIASFPVYRSYITAAGPSDRDRAWVGGAVFGAMRRNPVASVAVYRFLSEVLLEPDAGPMAAARSRFTGKFQQVTAPVMAKGVEDTAFYVYNRLVSLNEVGGEPARFGVEPESLHRWYGERQGSHPHALTPLSTHDTKRGEDVRARLNILSELPARWFEAVERWREINAPLRIRLLDLEAPDRNEEYLLYQTLVGAWPWETLDELGRNVFRDRIRAYMTKALHEAKVNTSWLNPHAEYDRAVEAFVTKVLQHEPFLADFLPFQAEIRRHGMRNALSQTLLKTTGPGVPDTYQGTELWDDSLVDPDNRRPVDYRRRAELLQDLKRRSIDPGSLVRDLLSNPEDGRIKLYTLWRSLCYRRGHLPLFQEGSYEPAPAVGDRSRHLFAFLRRRERHAALVVVPRLSTALAPPGTFAIPRQAWGDTGLLLKEIAPGTRLRNVFTEEILDVTEREGQGWLSAGQALGSFPVALVVTES